MTVPVVDRDEKWAATAGLRGVMSLLHIVVANQVRHYWWRDESVFQRSGRDLSTNR